MATRYPVYGGVNEYNPQDWRQNAPAPGAFRSHAAIRPQVVLTADLTTGPIPSPPPPYSPSDSPGAAAPASLNAIASPRHTGSPANAAMFGTPVSAVSTTSTFSPLRLRQSSGTTNNAIPASNNAAPSFPPPPGSTRDRSGSRTRDHQRGLFSLSALRNRSTDRLGAAALAQQNEPPQTQHMNVPSSRPGIGQAQYAPHQQSGDYAANRNTMYDPQQQQQPPMVPPAARRSASAGDAHATHYSSILPPPPPGPPPSASRSMSTDRTPNSVPIIGLPTRRPHQRGTLLETVPPTPANWTDDPSSYRPAELLDGVQTSRTPSPLPPLRVNTGADLQTSPALPAEVRVSEHAATESVSSNDSWQRVVRREPSIRERRSESRAARDRVLLIEEPLSIVSNAVSPRTGDLPLRSPGSGGMNRAGAVKKARHVPSPLISPAGPSGITRRSNAAVPTPPFSPALNSAQSMRKQMSQSMGMGQKGLPTPDSANPGSQETSNITSLNGALSPKRFGKTPMNLASPRATAELVASPAQMTPNGLGEDARNFVIRCQQFASKEQAASSDQERLELFAQFFVHESRLRRDRYSAAFSDMAGEVYDLTRDMWKSLQPTPSKTISEPPRSADLDRPQPSRQGSSDSYVTSDSPYSSRAAGTPGTEADSPADSTCSNGPRDGPSWRTYQPVLSPIPSMAMSTVPDEQESRGRAPSRWWESNSGSQTNERTQELERSRRESKYMSLQRSNLQWDSQPSPSPGFSVTPRAAQASRGEYPQEKTGWHDDLTPSYPSTTGHQLFAAHSPASTPGPHKLDVSRLVTLPPPYPRHYPAMNNNHPDLASVRTTLRSLPELSSLTATKTQFAERTQADRDRRDQDALTRKTQMRHNIQEQVSLGQMSYAEAAAAEQDFHLNESRSLQTATKREFDEFQPVVMTPLHALLSERITKATACITQLEDSLQNTPHDLSRNQQLQEEGDERPELLEKLNLLKWVFDAREVLHREMFLLEAERDDRYREVVITPMRSPGNEQRLHEVLLFFRKDKRDRKKVFDAARVTRCESLASSLDDLITRGAEDQLNAFWDIAPGLLEIVQQVPEDLDEAVDHDGFSVVVPESELVENEAYTDHPLQYLYSLLSHAEKSAYQLIEAQTNLACLLHEAHSGAAKARFADLETRRREEVGIEDDNLGLFNDTTSSRSGTPSASGSSGHTGSDGGNSEAAGYLKEEMNALKREEELRLTAELKDKVALVESQWREGLGAGLGECRERVERYLVGRGGWDEVLAE